MTFIVVALALCAAYCTANATKNTENIQNSREEYKKQLDQFVMSRKESYFITPPFVKNNMNIEELYRSTKNVNSDTEYEDAMEFEADVDIAELNKAIETDNSDKMEYADAMQFETPVPSIKSRKKLKQFQIYKDNNKNARNEDDDYDFAHKKDNENLKETPIDEIVIKQFEKQGNLIKALGRRYQDLLLRNQIKYENDIFNEILKGAEERKRNREARARDNIEAGAQSGALKKESYKKKPEMVTVMTMVEEEDVKKVLKADPFVQRIFKMARDKKKQYYHLAKEQAEERKERRKSHLRKNKRKNIKKKSQ